MKLKGNSLKRLIKLINLKLFYPGETKTYSHTSLYINVHSIIIYSSQTWKQFKCSSAGECINNVVYPYDVILINNKEEQTDTSNNMNESENGMLTEGNLTQKSTCCVNHF